MRACLLIGLVLLLAIGCASPDATKSQAQAERAKLAPPQPPPFLPAEPESSAKQSEAPQVEAAQSAPVLPPPTIEPQPAAPPRSEAVPSTDAQTPAGPQTTATPAPGANVEVTQTAGATEPEADDVPLDPGWPRILSANGQTFAIYQPQVDSWDGFTLEAYCPIAVESGGEQPPIFGVVSLSAHTLVDKDERVVALHDVKVSDARFPSAPEQAQAYGQVLQSALPRNLKSVSLDRLETQLAIQRVRSRARELPLDNTPPRILFAQQPSLLVYIDGDPQYVPVEGTNLARVVNTRVLLLKTAADKFYLHLLDGYVEAAAVTGPWSVAKTPPADAAKAEAVARELRQVDLLDEQDDVDAKKKPPSLSAGNAPQIIVATSPAELIVTQGKPSYVPISGTSLRYIKNTTADVFKLLTDQMTYVLLGGRWFRAKSMDGPWAFVAAKSLPKEFSRIPDASPKENVKSAVPGTRQAQEALIANQIPATARIDPKSTGFTLQIDGEPRLAAISGTSLQYVRNAAEPVIRADDKTWYACQSGVWFVASALNGPWAVATVVPPAIYSIPPSSPIYYVTYVRVYHATPAHVYVGYTPGYYGAVVAPGGVVVYGTGYTYSPWVGRYWYGYPATYGLGAAMTWTPWTGWAFGFGFGWPHGATWYRPPAPWWGPYYGWGYNARSGVTAWGPGGWAGTAASIYAQRASLSTVQRGKAGYNAFSGNQWAARYGVAYNSTTGALITGQKGALKNVFSGRGDTARGTATNTARSASVSEGQLAIGTGYKGMSPTAGGLTAKPGELSQPVVPVRDDSGSASAAATPAEKQVFGTKDGNVYRLGDKGQWERLTVASSVVKPPASPPQAGSAAPMPSQYTKRGAPSEIPSTNAARPLAGNMQDLDRQRRAQDVGNLRANSFEASRPPGGFHGSGAGSSRSSKAV